MFSRTALVSTRSCTHWFFFFFFLIYAMDEMNETRKVVGYKKNDGLDRKKITTVGLHLS